MGLDLPSELERLLNDLGFTWPEVDETDLFSLGSTWVQFGGTLQGVQQTAQTAANQVSEHNQGAAVEAFVAKWSGDKAPAHVVGDLANGAELGGAAIMMCAGLVLGLKINTIVNLGILLAEIVEALATAVPTFGASLAEIPVFKEIAQRVIGAIINEVVSAILG